MSSSSRCVQNHYNRPTLVSRKKPVLVFGCLSAPQSFRRASGTVRLEIMPVRSRTKRACHHGPTNTFVVATPIGEISIISCPRGLHCVTQSPDLCDKDFKPDKGCKVQLESQLYCDNGYTYPPALQCIQWLKNYFSREHNDRMPAFCPSILSDGSFTTKVWLKLVEVAPFGASISYKALSTAAGNSNAAQAVGQAMANNPIMLLVPCHRVIRSDGAFGNYAHGRRNSVKQWLLMFEKGEV